MKTHIEDLRKMIDDLESFNREAEIEDELKRIDKWFETNNITDLKMREKILLKSLENHAENWGKSLTYSLDKAKKLIDG